MLYVFYGEDIDKARTKIHETINSLLKKKPDASVFKINEDNFSQAQFAEYIESQGLFVNKHIIFCDQLMSNKEIQEYIEDKLKDIQKSENIFIMLEKSFLSASKKKIEKNAEKVQVFELAEKKPAKYEFNNFALADSLGLRDKKHLWMLYREAIKNGAVPEEIHGIIFWQLKSMIVASTASSASESGLKPFVYDKSKRFSKNFKDGELIDLLTKLVGLYHDAHRGLINFELGLEKFLLEV